MPRQATRAVSTRLGILVASAAVAAIVAACGPAATTAPPAAASVAAPSVAASAAPSVAPSVAASQAAGGGPLAEALVKALNADPLILHLEQVATAKTSLGTQEQTADVRLSGDLNGEDVAMKITGTSGGQAIDQEIIVIGDAAYARQGSGAWQQGARSSVASSITALFKAIRLVDDAGALRDAGTETIDGQELRHLTASGTIPYVPAAGGTGQYDVFDIYVLEDGTPVLARTAFSATGPNGEAVTGTTDFTFSKVGGPIEITAPSVGP
jgi:hypothetical protein